MPAGKPGSPAIPGGKGPLSAAEADRLLAPLAEARSVALAVSGGPDSLALLLATHRWAARRSDPPAVHVLTVDHALRPASGEEAQAVAALAARLGFPVEVLVWEEPKPIAGVEEAAREARYRLLSQAAVRIGATMLVTAHHQDDQAETFLLRLAGGSGLAGLAAMRPERDLGGGLTLFRPFLGTPKARLAATAAAAGLVAVDDPSNRDPRYARARLRALMPALAAEGLSPAALARAAARLARASDAIEHYAGRLIAAAVAADARGGARLDRRLYAAEPAEVRLRALTRLLAAVGGRAYPPASDRLERLDAALCGEGRFRRTLAGVIVGADGATALLRREPGRAASIRPKAPAVAIRSSCAETPAPEAASRIGFNRAGAYLSLDGVGKGPPPPCRAKGP